MARPHFAMIPTIPVSQTEHPPAIEIEIDHRCRVERQCLAQEKPAYYRYAQWLPHLRTHTQTYRKRPRPEYGSHGGHNDGTKSQQAGTIYCLPRLELVTTFRFDGEVDHDDGVLLHHADQQDHTDKGDQAEICFEHQ